jgi:hypothetical protein
VFEMAAPIQSPAKNGVCSVTWLLNAKGEHPAKIHKQIVAVYGIVMNQQNVTKWCCEFSEGRTNVHEAQRSSTPSLISDDLLHEIEEEICANWHWTISELHHIITELSKTTIHEAVIEKLGYRKLCAHWVPKILWTITTALLETFKWDDLTPSDFHLFLHLQKHLNGKRFNDDDEVQKDVMAWFKGQAADFYDSGIQKLVPRLNKCLDNGGDYVEK